MDMQHSSHFKPAWWLPGAHLQTIWATISRRRIKVVTHRERIELPDGDFVDIDWAGSGSGPVVLILHGLGGSIASPYAVGLLQQITQQGWRAVFMHFRGCSGEYNRLSRTYHCGETEDAKYVASVIKQREPQTPLAVVGVSLGGSVLLKWLAEQPAQVTAAVAVSVPFELHKAADRMNQGFSRFYQWYLLKDLKNFVKNKFAQQPAPIDFGDLKQINSFWKFDDKITAPLNGFSGAHDYYSQASARYYLRDIKTTTLILHAADDPFMTPDAIPEKHEMSEHITLELTKTGGHVGFIAGKIPFRPVYWLEHRVIEFLKPQFVKTV